MGYGFHRERRRASLKNDRQDESTSRPAEPDGPPIDPTVTNVAGSSVIAAGERLAGRYVIEGLLGTGAMGMVYRARDEELGLEVALKVLRPEYAADDTLLERFRRELVLARQVSHKHVVRIHDLGRDDRLVFLTMDLVQGSSLRRQLEERGRFEPAAAASIAAQLARALAAAHERGVIHRDLKPSNVMLDPDGDAYITDFGIARSMSAAGMTRTGLVVGTPEYLSPEQVRGEELDGRSDIYALGVLLFELLTGQLPMSAQTADETLAQHLRGVPSRLKGLPSDVPASLRAILKRCLEPDRRRRYQSAGDVAADLETLSRPSRQLPSRRVLLGIAAGGVVLALLALAYFRRGDRPAAERAAAETAPATLVIFPFADQTGRADLAWLASGVPELLFESLVGQAEIGVANPERVAQIVDDLKVEPGDLSEATLRLAAELLDSSRLMTGSVRGADGGGIRIDARLVDPAAGLAAASFLHAEAPAGPGAAAEAVSRLQASLLDALAISGEAAEPALESIALPLYTEALQTLWRGEPLAALEGLEGAVERDPEFGAAWLRLAQACEVTGRYDRALEASDRAVATLGADPIRHERLYLLARAQQARLSGEPDRAQQILGQVVEAYPGDVESAIELADAYGIEGRFGEALELLAEIVERAPANAQAWFLRAKYSILSGQSRVAVDDYLLRAMVLHNKLQNRQGQADVMNAFGVAYRELGETEQAEESYRRAAELRRDLGDDRGYATTLRNLAQIAVFRGDYEGAEQRLLEAQALFEKLGDQSGIAELYNDLGYLEEERSDYEQALANYRSGLQIRRELGDKRAIAQSLNNIGFANHQLGSYDDASVYWQQALALYEETDNLDGQTTVRMSLGQLHTTRGNWPEAQRLLLEALAGARQLGWEPAIAATEGYLGRVAHCQGRFAAALAHFEDALERFRAGADTRGLVEFSLAKADALLDLGASAEVLALTGELEAPTTEVGSVEQRAELFRLRALAHRLAGDDDAAAASRGAADTTVRETGNQALRLRVRLAGLAASASLARHRELVADAQALGDKRLELEAELALIQALLGAGRHDEAAAAADRVERSTRRLGDWAGAYRLYDLRAELARARGEDPSRWRELSAAELERITTGLAPERARSLLESAGPTGVSNAA